MAGPAHGARLDASRVARAGNVRYARSDEAQREMPLLPSWQRRKVRGSRNDRRRPPGSLLRTGYIFGCDAAPLESAGRAGRSRRIGSLVQRSRTYYRSSRSTQAVPAAARVAVARKNLAGIFGAAVLRLPSQPHSSGAE